MIPVPQSPIGPARLVRLSLAGAADPIAAARWLRGEPRPVVLAGEWAGGGVLLTSHPAAVACERDDPFGLLDAQPGVDRAGVAGEAVGGGWLGWLGFGLGRRLEPVPPPPPRPRPLPDFDLAFHDHVVRCDADGRWWFEALWTDARAAELESRLEAWRARLATTPPPAVAVAAGPLLIRSPGAAGHAAAVAETVERIAAGEVFQANVCLRLEGPVDGDLLDVWVRAAGGLGPSYAAYVGGDGHAIASLSPELFLRRRGLTATTQPIKGTALATAALASSEKDRAENTMIVDLARNDLGRVCEYGTVEVTELCEPRRGPGVWHLVSTVTGTLREDVGAADLLRATFPPGSVTGAPKVQALKVISQVEATAREAYCGAIGICSPLSGLELNVAIRTLEASAGRLWMGAGGGIVSDSSSAGELDEALAKARGVADAAGIAVAAAAVGEAPAPPGVVRDARPDPARGLLETLLVRGGRCPAAAAHLARLRGSCAVLGLAVPADLEAIVRGAARTVAEGRLRVVLDAGGVRTLAGALPPPGAVTLLPVVLPGGLGEHKWADRDLIDAHTAPGRAPLFCDLDGHVLEAGHAAVMIVERGRVVAPPLDGRLLPSTSRAQALDRAAGAGMAVVLEPVTLERARRAEAVVLTSALRGPHPGELPGGPPASAAEPVCALLASG